MTEIQDLPDWVEGGEYPADVSGWRNLTLSAWEMVAKEKRIWLKATFSDSNGTRADLSQNIFTKPETDGEKKANQITFSRLKDLWKAAGLAEADYPAPNPRAVANALRSYEGSLTVEVMCKQNDRGYTEAVRFRKTKEQETAA